MEPRPFLAVVSFAFPTPAAHLRTGRTKDESHPRLLPAAAITGGRPARLRSTQAGESLVPRLD